MGVGEGVEGGVRDGLGGVRSVVSLSVAAAVAVTVILVRTIFFVGVV